MTEQTKHPSGSSRCSPLHDRARATARRLCRSSADGDDLFHEAVLRALGHLGELRDDANRREPGMTDAQLRDKIRRQLAARGQEGEVTVTGDDIQIRVKRRIEK